MLGLSYSFLGELQLANLQNMQVDNAIFNTVKITVKNTCLFELLEQ